MAKRRLRRTQGSWAVRIEKIEIKSLRVEIPVLVFSRFTRDGQEVRISAFPHLGIFTFEPKEVSGSVDETLNLGGVKARLMSLGMIPPWCLDKVEQNIIATWNLIKQNKVRRFLKECKSLEAFWKKTYVK